MCAGLCSLYFFSLLSAPTSDMGLCPSEIISFSYSEITFQIDAVVPEITDTQTHKILYKSDYLYFLE